MRDGFIQAIAREEGFNVKGSRAQRNNNPGNLNYASWEQEFGATLEVPRTGEIARFACFPSAAQGFAALKKLVTDDYIGLSIRQAVYKWAPPVENATDSYIKNVASWMAISPDTVLTTSLIDISTEEVA